MADMDEIRAMVEGGMSITAIANELKLSTSHISRIVNALGLSDSVKRRTVLTALTPAQVEEVVRLYLDGESAARIILQYNLNYNALYRLLNEQGVALRVQGPDVRELRKQRLDWAIRMYIEGASINNIEIETGIRQPVLHLELARRKVPLRKFLRQTAGPGFDTSDGMLELFELTDREHELLRPEDDPHPLRPLAP